MQRKKNTNISDLTIINGFSRKPIWLCLFRLFDDVRLSYGVIEREGVKAFFRRAILYLRGKRFPNEPLKFVVKGKITGGGYIILKCDFCMLCDHAIELFGKIESPQKIKNIEIFIDKIKLGFAEFDDRSSLYFYKKNGFSSTKKHILGVKVSTANGGHCIVTRIILKNTADECPRNMKIYSNDEFDPKKREVIGNPKVSIIILTNNKKPAVLGNCLNSFGKSTYNNFEIIIVENGAKPFSLENARVITKKEKFNYSKFVNEAAAQAKGDYLLFLNDDTEIIAPDWIESMLLCAQKEKTGVVGAKLLYPNGTIQHAGIFLKNNEVGSGHFGRYYPGNSDSIDGILKSVHSCDAVTFACAMVKKELFEKLGGLDEEYNILCSDVDFCLKLSKLGYETIITPFALLYHMEAQSRGNINCNSDIRRFKERWGEHVIMRPKYEDHSRKKPGVSGS